MKQQPPERTKRLAVIAAGGPSRNSGYGAADY